MLSAARPSDPTSRPPDQMRRIPKAEESSQRAKSKGNSEYRRYWRLVSGIPHGRAIKRLPNASETNQQNNVEIWIISDNPANCVARTRPNCSKWTWFHADLM